MKEVKGQTKQKSGSKLKWDVERQCTKPPCYRITETQNSRDWKGPLWVILSNPPAEAGSPTAGCTGPCPGGSWISLEKENPQPPWAACSSAPSPSEGRSSSSCSDGTSCASVCAYCPLSCQWAPLKRAWPCPDTHPSDICKHLLGPLAASSSSGWTNPAPSASPPRGDVPVNWNKLEQAQGYIHTAKWHIFPVVSWLLVFWSSRPMQVNCFPPNLSSDSSKMSLTHAAGDS